MQVVRLGDLTADAAAGPARQRPTYPASVRRRELDPVQMGEVRDGHQRLAALTSVLTSDQTFTDTYTRALLRAESTAWRADRAGGRTYARHVVDRISRLQAQVHLVPPGPVTLAARSGRIPVTVVNDLDEQVTVRVGVEAVPSVRLSLVQPAPVVLEPHSSSTLDIAADATTNGSVQVVARLLTTRGSRVRAAADVPGAGHRVRRGRRADRRRRARPAHHRAGRAGGARRAQRPAAAGFGRLGAGAGPVTERPGVPADDPTVDPLADPLADVSESDASVIRSSTVMATGTIVSRVTGVLRTTALTAAVGTGLLADAYNTANTLPNIIYILLIGGALNAVFIPQLVRHMKDDADGGTSYADRLLTLSGLVLLGITTVAVITAPWVTPLYAGNDWTPHQLQVLTQFAYLCLPQIFFYGMYALYSQVLNTRGRFGAPMFAPIVNNVVVIAGCIAFIAVDHSPEHRRPSAPAASCCSAIVHHPRRRRAGAGAGAR